MDVLSVLGLGKPHLSRDDHNPIATLVQREYAIRRVLRFTGYSIDDVINDPFARSVVKGYYKLSRRIDAAGANPIWIPPPDHVRL
jgi:hypothetical protein